MAENEKPRSGRAAPAGRGTGKVTAGHGRGGKAQRARRGSGRQRAGVVQSAPQDEARDTGAQNRQRKAQASDAGRPGDSAPLKTSEGAGFSRIRERRHLSERMGRSTRMRLWLQSSALDFALVLVVAVALVYTVSYGFYSAEAYRGNVALLVGLCIPLLLALFAGSWSKRMVAVSAVAVLALCGVYIGVAAALSPDPALFSAEGVNDVAGNYTIFTLVLCVTTILSYLLSRRTVGLVFLLIAGVVACGVVQFLWREWLVSMAGLPAFIVVFLGIGMLFVYQSYKQSVYSANRVKRTSFAGAFAYSALIGVVCVAVGAGVFVGIAAIAPGTMEIKPFEHHVSPPIDELANAYEKKDTENDQTTNETDEREEETSDSDKGGRDSGVGGLGVLQGSFIANAAQSLAGYNPDDPEQDFENIAYLVLTWEMVILGALVVLLAVAVIAAQRYRRTLRLKRIAGKSPGYQAWYLYTFLLGRLKRLKLDKPAHLTPLEFAVGFSRPMQPFTRGTGGVDFVDVSSIYQDAAFGGEEPSALELEDVKAYYRAFFKNARSYVGWPRWVLWKFWRI